MSNLNFIAGGIIIAFCAIIIGIRLYKNHKDNNKIESIDAFIEVYGDSIIKALKHSIMILEINMNNFDTKEDYESSIISTTIEDLKSSATDFGIPDNVIKLIDTKALTEVIVDCFNSNKRECLNILGRYSMEYYSKIIDPSIINYNTKNEDNPNS